MLKKIASALTVLALTLGMSQSALAESRSGRITRISMNTNADTSGVWRFYVYLDTVDGTSTRMCGTFGTRLSARLDTGVDKNAVLATLTAAWLAGKRVTLSSDATGQTTCMLTAIDVEN